MRHSNLIQPLVFVILIGLFWLVATTPMVKAAASPQNVKVTAVEKSTRANQQLNPLIKEKTRPGDPKTKAKNKSKMRNPKLKRPRKIDLPAPSRQKNVSTSTAPVKVPIVTPAPVANLTEKTGDSQESNNLAKVASNLPVVASNQEPVVPPKPMESMDFNAQSTSAPSKTEETASSSTPPTTTQSEPANAGSTEKSSPLQPKVGVFMTSLYGFDLRNQSFNTTLWVWFVHNYEDFKPEETIEIVNAHSYTRDKLFVLPKDNQVKWAQVKFSGKIAHNWDISNFPFDHQMLEIFMEDSELDYSGIRYIADKRNSKIDTHVQLPDWNIVNFEVDSGPITYQTTYGDPDLEDGESTYSHLVIRITLERKGTRLFFNMFTALYIAFILSSVAFFVPLDNTSARLSLATAAIFSAIGNKYVVDSMLPSTASLTLVDKLQILTFLFIGIMVIVTVSYAYFGQAREALMKTINRYGEVIFPLTYMALNGYWIYVATR